MSLIFSETLYPGYHQTMEVVGDILVDEQSPFQHIQIFDTQSVGRVLALDGVVQITERDEAGYSEMLAHVPILEHGYVRRVLIVGGGDGAVAEEVLKHPNIHVEMCEIDARVIELSKTHLSRIHKGVFDHPDLTVHVRDAFDFMQCPLNQNRFDLIIADRPDPIGPAQVLFQTPFYEAVKRSLTDDGIAVFQNGVPFFQPEELTETFNHVRSVFENTGCYITAVPTYVGGFMALVWSSKKTHLGKIALQALQTRFVSQSLVTEYYNPAIHLGAFALPTWISRLVPEDEGGDKEFCMSQLEA